MLPTITNNYTDSTPQFKAGCANILCDIAMTLGKDVTMTKILPILKEFLKDDNSEVKQNTIQGL